MSVKLGVIGAGGRMGREIIAAIARDPRVELGGAVEAAGHPCVGAQLVGGLTICSNSLALAHGCKVLVDFTTPDALGANLEAACSARRAILVGTTGLGAAQMKAIDAATRTVAVLQSANTSMGVALLVALVEDAAAKLAAWDAEVLELHHGGKADAPSGTALMLGAAIAKGRGGTAFTAKVSRAGVRAAGEIGFASVRGGSSAGEHSAMFLGDGERIELVHRAESRAIFARGAVEAALWLAGRAPGRYTMADVLAG